MWLLVALMGAAMASTAIDFGSGAPAPEEDAQGGGASRTEAEDEDSEGEGEMVDHAEPATETADAAAAEDDAPTDAWLDGWTEDDYVSTDKPEPVEVPDGMPYEPAVPPNEPGAERDAWLDGWKDDEYLSTDDPAVPAAPLLPRAGTAGLVGGIRTL